VDKAHGVNANLPDETAVDSGVLWAPVVPGVRLERVHVHDGSERAGVDQSANRLDGRGELGGSHLAEGALCRGCFDQDAVQPGGGKRARLFRQHVLAPAQTADRMLFLIDPARGAQRDQVDVWRGDQLVQARTTAHAGGKGIVRIVCHCNDLGATRQLERELMTVCAVQPDADDRLVHVSILPAIAYSQWLLCSSER